MAQSYECRLFTADEFALCLPILFKSAISRQLLKGVQRSTLIRNLFTDVPVENGAWLQAALKLKETWVSR
jgi:hypothetical protein